MINQFRLYILQNFKNDDSKKDIITIISLVFLTTIIGISILTMEGTFSTLIEHLNLFVKEPYKINPLPNIAFIDIKNEIRLIIYVVITPILSLIVMFITNKIMKLKIFTRLVISYIVNYLAMLLFFPNIIIFLLMLITIILLMNLFIPIGSGKYFHFIELASYFSELYKNNFLKKKINGRRVLYYFILLFVFSLLVQLMIPTKLVFWFASLIFVALTLLFYLSSYENEIEKNFKRIIVFVCLIPFVLLNIGELDGIVALVLSISTVFFAFDRIVSSMTALKKDLLKESLLYLIELNVDENKSFIYNELKNIAEIDLAILKENEIIRQIILHFKIGEYINLERLIDYYNENYSKNKKIVNNIKYVLKFDYFESNEERIAYLKDNFQEDGIVYITEIYIHYGILLAITEKDYSVLDEQIFHLTPLEMIILEKKSDSNTFDTEISELDRQEFSLMTDIGRELLKKRMIL